MKVSWDDYSHIWWNKKRFHTTKQKSHLIPKKFQHPKFYACNPSSLPAWRKTPPVDEFLKMGFIHPSYVMFRGRWSTSGWIEVTDFETNQVFPGTCGSTSASKKTHEIYPLITGNAFRAKRTFQFYPPKTTEFTKLRQRVNAPLRSWWLPHLLWRWWWCGKHPTPELKECGCKIHEV